MTRIWTMVAGAGLLMGAITGGAWLANAQTTPPKDTVVAGKAYAIDGDTIAISWWRIRIWGIDAPETKQDCFAGAQRWACGKMAASMMAVLLRGKQTRCVVRDHDRYERLIAICYADGQDVGAYMVATGWAVAYSHYSTMYEPQELLARKDRLGMWGSWFEMPWDWRAMNKGKP